MLLASSSGYSTSKTLVTYRLLVCLLLTSNNCIGIIHTFTSLTRWRWTYMRRLESSIITCRQSPRNGTDKSWQDQKMKYDFKAVWGKIKLKTKPEAIVNMKNH